MKDFTELCTTWQAAVGQVGVGSPVHYVLVELWEEKCLAPRAVVERGAGENAGPCTAVRVGRGRLCKVLGVSSVNPACLY